MSKVGINKNANGNNANKNKYYDLTNFGGRLFPTWILKNYRKYVLKKIEKNKNEDPCNTNINKDSLREYQTFLSAYLNYESPYRSILVYHSMGSGKTTTAINIYNILYNYTPGWNVFILIKASLKDDPWMKDLNRWLSEDDKEHRMKNIIFIHYDSPYADDNFIDAIKTVDASKKNLFIIDEAHNFIRNVYSNITSREGKRAQVIYEYIIQDYKDNDHTRIVLLSGTPAVNNPYEFALIYNMLRPNIFPSTELEFNNIFITAGQYQHLNPSSKNLFQRRIIGLTSYYLGATPDTYASKSINYIDLPMEKYQDDIYAEFEKTETEAAINSGNNDSLYRSYTRQVCNFVFPNINGEINGSLRPRPNKFKISISEANLIDEGKSKIKFVGENKDKLFNLKNYQDTISKFIDYTKEYFNNIKNDDLKNGRTIFNDYDSFKNEYDGDFFNFYKNAPNKSNLFKELYKCSPKYIFCVFTILKCKGPVVVYSNYVKMEGLESFKIYLELFGFSVHDPENTSKGLFYGEYHGGIKDRSIREATRKKYNEKQNMYGEYLKIIMISPAGSEGISLNNVGEIHILESYWNENRISQIIARGIRQCSHADLPMKDRHVNVYRYKALRLNGAKMTSDQYIEELAKNKDNLIGTFSDAIKESAVDCELFKEHNMLNSNYKCFKFSENSFFDKNVGPVYKDDIYDDMKMDNGSNSTNSYVKQVKVMKIKAVEKLDKNENVYSDPKDYWINHDTDVIYDYELKYPIGKIMKDADNLPIKINSNTFVIGYKLPI